MDSERRIPTVGATYARSHYTSTITDREENLTNVEPITIGSGPGSSFFGTLADVAAQHAVTY